MKFSRSTSSHLTNISFRSNNVTTIQTPQSNSRLSEVNSKIDDLLKKSQTTLFKADVKCIQQEKKISQAHNYTLTLEQIQKEKKQLLTLLLQKDSIIRDQQNRITELDLQNKNLIRQVQQYANIQPQMEQLEEQCQQIVKENEQLKYEKNQIQTSLNFLKCQNLQIVSNEIKNSLQQLHQQIKKHYFCSYNKDFYNLEQSRMSVKMYEYDYYSVLRDCLDTILFMIQNTDEQLKKY